MAKIDGEALWRQYWVLYSSTLQEYHGRPGTAIIFNPFETVPPWESQAETTKVTWNALADWVNDQAESHNGV